MKRIKVNKEHLIFLFLLLLIFNLFHPYKGKTPILKEGDLSLKDIIAPYTFKILKYKDELNQEREKAARQVPPVLRVIKERETESMLPKLDSIITFYADISPYKWQILRKKQDIKNLFLDVYDKGIVLTIENLPESKSDRLLIEGIDSTFLVERSSILGQKQARESFAKRVDELFPYFSIEEPFMEDLNKLIAPNLVIDFAGTDKMRAEARDAIPDSLGVVRKGVKIVGANEIVTEREFRKLYSLRSHQDRRYSYSLLNNISRNQLYFLLVCLFALAFIRFRVKRAYENSKFLYLFLMNIAIIFVLYKILPNYLIPLASFVMFFTLAVNLDFGVLIAVTSILVISLYENFNLIHLIPVFTGSLAGGILSGNFKNREELYRTGMFVAAITSFLIFAVELYKRSNLRDISIGFSYGIVNGVLSILILFGLLYIFERIFHITTNFTWMEYSDLNNPLIKRLSKEAPGSYQHALMVSTLAENAGEAIGANSLLAKVGGLFHDIGKLRRPRFFAENFKDDNNPHDELPPKLSAIIIKSHIQDALKMARQYQLPEEIIDIIKQHQGTSLIRPFYEKARKMLDEVDEDYFKYDAEVPVSKEASILMLADMVEATVRSLDNPTPDEVRKTIDDRIRTAYSNGQLSKSMLSLQDLEIVAQDFAQSLEGLHHHRPKYPTQSE
ncbi:HDIG domain-containing protein [candidate division WOR-3 bacterium]|nr:HDIG domain-containing protein [candidate division WOR-3 bacterium]